MPDNNFIIVPGLYSIYEFYIFRDNGIEVKVTRKRNKITFTSSVYSLSLKEKQELKKLINKNK